MSIKSTINTLFLISVFLLFIQGCNDSKPTENNTPALGENDEPITTPLNIDQFSSPEKVARSNTADVNIEVSGVKNDALIKYRFLPDADGIHFKPNSGVIAKNNLIGTLKSQYIAPEVPGLYRYTVELYGVDNEVTQREFTIEVTN